MFAVDEGIFGALGVKVKVNSVPGTIDRCTVEEVVNGWSLGTRVSTY